MTGSDYELCNAAAKAEGLAPKWSNVNFGTLISGVELGRYNAACAGINITSERLGAVNFVPYRTTTWAFLQPTHATSQARTLDQLCGRRVAELLGSIFAKAVSQQSTACTSKGQQAIQLSTFPTVAEAVTQITNGRADVVVLDGGVAEYYLSKSPGALKVSQTGLNPAPVGVAVAKANTALGQRLAQGFKQIYANGTYASILKKYHLSTQSRKDFTPQTS
jgi:polar amino acid transport system substrate-binding protein